MRPPVLPSASMTLLIAVAGVAIYWITAAVADLRLQHSYSKFAADTRSSDHTPRPEESAGHESTDAVIVGATAGVTENVFSVATDGHTRRTVRPHRQYVVSNSGVVRSRQTTTFSFLPSPRGSRWIMTPLTRRTRHCTSIHTYSTETEEMR